LPLQRVGTRNKVRHNGRNVIKGVRYNGIWRNIYSELRLTQYRISWITGHRNVKVIFLHSTWIRTLKYHSGPTTYIEKHFKIWPSTCREDVRLVLWIIWYEIQVTHLFVCTSPARIYGAGKPGQWPIPPIVANSEQAASVSLYIVYNCSWFGWRGPSPKWSPPGILFVLYQIYIISINISSQVTRPQSTSLKYLVFFYYSYFEIVFYWKLIGSICKLYLALI
jgi:hypothetical protein